MRWNSDRFFFGGENQMKNQIRVQKRKILKSEVGVCWGSAAVATLITANIGVD